jgi:hypothetical protein
LATLFALKMFKFPEFQLIIQETLCLRNLKTYLIQGVIEMHGQILTTSYWLYIELGKNI